MQFLRCHTPLVVVGIACQRNFRTAQLVHDFVQAVFLVLGISIYFRSRSLSRKFQIDFLYSKLLNYERLFIEIVIFAKAVMLI